MSRRVSRPEGRDQGRANRETDARKMPEQPIVHSFRKRVSATPPPNGGHREGKALLC